MILKPSSERQTRFQGRRRQEDRGESEVTRASEERTRHPKTPMPHTVLGQRRGVESWSGMGGSHL